MDEELERRREERESQNRLNEKRNDFERNHPREESAGEYFKRKENERRQRERADSSY